MSGIRTMKPFQAFARVLLSSLGVISMYASTLDFIPAPYSSLVVGGGAGLLTVTAVGTMVKRKGAIGVVGALPGMPVKSHKSPKKSSAPRTKDLDKERLLRKYDKAFTELMERQGSAARSEMLERMKPIIYELSSELKAWSGDARLRAYLLMKAIVDDLDDPKLVQASLGLLLLFLSKGGNSALEMARPMFRDKIKAMYDKNAKESQRFLPRLLLMLDNYDEKAVESLTKDAIHLWGEEQFKAAREYLGFEELKERGLRSKMKSFLRAEIERAGNEMDRIALERAVELYHEVT
jgi:hypothetical protein